MDVTAIRTRVCDHAWKVHVPISIQLLSLSAAQSIAYLSLRLFRVHIYTYIAQHARARALYPSLLDGLLNNKRICIFQQARCAT